MVGETIEERRDKNQSMSDQLAWVTEDKEGSEERLEQSTRVGVRVGSHSTLGLEMLEERSAEARQAEGCLGNDWAVCSGPSWSAESFDHLRKHGGDYGRFDLSQWSLRFFQFKAQLNILDWTQRSIGL